MLSFLRPRPVPPSVVESDGVAVTFALGATLAGQAIALDLDGSFLSHAEADRDGRARFDFPFAPSGRTEGIVQARRGRDGETLSEPHVVRFGMSSNTRIAAGIAHAAASPALEDIGAFVPAGVDCAASEVAVVVPIYDAPELVARCLDSVVAHTRGRARLIAIDDASPDPAIAPLLARYARLTNVTVLRNERNRGFTATANRGIAEASRADVVLLNADTEVGPNWLTGLRRAAATADDVATVTAVSDNAGAFSVPELERENAMPSAWRFEDTARALWQYAGRAYPELPTGNGFCMYVRRAALDAAGTLDEAAFPQGYGEENDFCQRASARGFRHLVAGNVYVRHARSASFGAERRIALGRAGMAVLRERWPNYEADVGATLHSFERRVLDWRVRRLFAASARLRPGRRLLVADDHASSSEDAIRRRLQADAIEIVVTHADASIVTRAANALCIPIAHVARGADIEAVASAALAAACCFAEPPR